MQFIAPSNHLKKRIYSEPLEDGKNWSDLSQISKATDSSFIRVFRKESHILFGTRCTILRQGSNALLCVSVVCVGVDVCVSIFSFVDWLRLRFLTSWRKKRTDIANQFAIIKVSEPLQKFEIQIQLKPYHFGFSIKALWFKNIIAKITPNSNCSKKEQTCL